MVWLYPCIHQLKPSETWRRVFSSLGLGGLLGTKQLPQHNELTEVVKGSGFTASVSTNVMQSCCCCCNGVSSMSPVSVPKCNNMGG